MRVKTYKKSSAFWKHGKHASILPEIKRREREISRAQHKPEMHDSVQEAFKTAQKKR